MQKWPKSCKSKVNFWHMSLAEVLHPQPVAHIVSPLPQRVGATGRQDGCFACTSGLGRELNVGSQASPSWKLRAIDSHHGVCQPKPRNTWGSWPKGRKCCAVTCCPMQETCGVCKNMHKLFHHHQSLIVGLPWPFILKETWTNDQMWIKSLLASTLTHHFSLTMVQLLKHSKLPTCTAKFKRPLVFADRGWSSRTSTWRSRDIDQARDAASSWSSLSTKEISLVQSLETWNGFPLQQPDTAGSFSSRPVGVGKVTARYYKNTI